MSFSYTRDSGETRLLKGNVANPWPRHQHFRHEHAVLFFHRHRVAIRVQPCLPVSISNQRSIIKSPVQNFLIANIGDRLAHGPRENL